MVPKPAACGLLATAVLCLAACSGGSLPPSSPPASSARAPAPNASLNDAHWGRFRSHRFGLSIPLPEGDTWAIDDHSAAWLVARHRGTGSVVRARAWHEPVRMNRERCEARAREWAADLPVQANAQIIDERALPNAPGPEFESYAWAGVFVPSRGSADPLRGFVLAVGAHQKQCFVIAFETGATGSSGSVVVADRLAIGSRIVEGTALRSDLAPGRHGE